MTPGPSATPPEVRTVSVLLIDDDFDIRQVLSEIIEDEGFSVQSAPNGAAALDLLTTVTPKVILLDLNMPVMSGREFRIAQRRDPALARIPTVVISAIDRMGESIADLEPDLTLAKPIRLTELIAIVRRYAGVAADG